MIVAVVGAIILFTGTKLWAGEAEKGFDKETCRASVTMISLSKITTGFPWLKLKCSTEVKELDTEEKFKEELVQSMKNCWYQYGAGKIDFISNWDFGWGDTNCFVCSVLIPKEEISLSGKGIYPFFQGYGYVDFKFDKDLIVSPNDPLYVMYGITPEKSSLEWKDLTIIPLFFYGSGARYGLIISTKNKAKKVCDKGPFKFR